MEPIKIGQAWVFDAQGDVPPLLCAIGAIDTIKADDGIDRVLSMRITPHPEAQAAGWTVVGHVPITEKAFVESGPHLAPEPVMLDAGFQEGYEMWREKFDAGAAGAFTRSVQDVYMMISSFAAEKAAANN